MGEGGMSFRAPNAPPRSKKPPLRCLNHPSLPCGHEGELSEIPQGTEAATGAPQRAHDVPSGRHPRRTARHLRGPSVHHGDQRGTDGASGHRRHIGVQLFRPNSC